MINEQNHKVHLSLEDQERLTELRSQKPARNVPKLALAPGAKLADQVAEIVGSWRFIMIQSVLLGIWVVLNTLAFIDLPPLKWSSLKYIFQMEDKIDSKQEAYSGRDCCEASAGRCADSTAAIVKWLFLITRQRATRISCTEQN